MEHLIGRDAIHDLVAARRWTELRKGIASWPEPEIADVLAELSSRERAFLFRILPRKVAGDVFAELDAGAKDELLRDLTDEETRELMEELEPDERTHLLEELPGQVTQRLINLLPPRDLREARTLLGYPDESVGRLMTPHYVMVQPDWTVRQAFEHIRSRGEEYETVNIVYVVDAAGVLQDAVGIRRLLMSHEESPIGDLVRGPVIQLRATDDREEAVRTMQRYDLDVLPVVDRDGVLLGIVTWDDVMDVAEEEVTEDFHKMATVGLLRTSLKEAGVGLLWRARIGWLLVLIFVNIFSGAGIAYFEDTIEAVVALVFFLPLLIDSAGNAGSQSATLMVRALATGDVRVKDWFGLLAKEFTVALLIGVTMALGAATVAYFRAPEVLLVVSATMVLVVVVGSLIGMLLPFLLTRLDLDPATASGPLITSLADITGVLIYFSIASWYLSAVA